MTDLAAPGSHLPEARRAEIPAIHRHDGRALRAAVSLQRTNAELIFKGQRNALRQLFGAHQYIFKRAEALRRAAPHIALQEGRRRHDECHLIFLDKPADHLRIERIGMKDHAHAIAPPAATARR